MYDFKNYYQFIQKKAIEPLQQPVQSNAILLPFLGELTNQSDLLLFEEDSINRIDAVKFEENLIATFNGCTIEESLIVKFYTISIEKLFSSKSEEYDFVREVVEIATSNEIISELSNELGSPRKEETENDFVNRGKNILRKILQETFDQK